MIPKDHMVIISGTSDDEAVTDVKLQRIVSRGKAEPSWAYHRNGLGDSGLLFGSTPSSPKMLDRGDRSSSVPPRFSLTQSLPHINLPRSTLAPSPRRPPGSPLRKGAMADPSNEDLEVLRLRMRQLCSEVATVESHGVTVNGMQVSEFDGSALPEGSVVSSRNAEGASLIHSWVAHASVEQKRAVELLLVAAGCCVLGAMIGRRAGN